MEMEYIYQFPKVMTIREFHNNKMNIHEFLDRFGVDSTTNFQLIKWSKDLKIPKLYCIMRNELNKLKKLKLKNKPLYIICNYQTSNESGSHWIAMYRGNSVNFYFDSYGIELFPEAKEFLEECVFSTLKIQKEGQKMCGQLSLFVLYKLSKGCDFYDTVLELSAKLF
jgi:hypothetical protein